MELWRGYEDCGTPEAKFARALDKLEVQHQHNLADLKTWTEQELDLVCTKMDREYDHDSALKMLMTVPRSRVETKMQKGGVNVAEVIARPL